ncbi:LapA family protein [Methylobacillus flagellatus]|uniref:LapA family protein n=1 Tax=Methylobacillus flagellatus TaxID=405 RepID=UPI0010FA0C61|nr:LapA family protein [Methylobacillus flagellatus]
MRATYLFFTAVLFILLLGFALKNADLVELQYYLGFSWRAPLSLMLLITFGLGILFGILACLTPLIRQRRQLLAYQRELKSLRGDS